MTGQNGGNLLVKEDRQPRVTTATVAPVGGSAEGHLGEMLFRLEMIGADLRKGNVDAAIRAAHLVSGRSARLGDRRTAGLMRRAVMMSRFYVLDQAAELVAEAERGLMEAAEATR